MILEGEVAELFKLLQLHPVTWFLGLRSLASLPLHMPSNGSTMALCMELETAACIAFSFSRRQAK